MNVLTTLWNHWGSHLLLIGVSIRIVLSSQLLVHWFAVWMIMIRREILNALIRWRMHAADSSSVYLTLHSVFFPTNLLKYKIFCMSPRLSDEFQNFVRRLPTFYALNMSAIQYFWKMEPNILQRYKQLEISTQQLASKAHRIINKIFTLSKRCQSQPKIIMLRERWGAEA